MKIHQGFENLPSIPRAVVSTGSFDGVHLGHRSIIAKMQDTAKDIQGETVIVTFNPHPRHALYPNGQGKDLWLLNSLEEKAGLLQNLGVQHLIVVPFTKTFAATSYQDFIQYYLVEKLHAKAIVVGANHHFGKNREGSSADIHQKYGITHNTQLQLVPANEEHYISSTLIRQLISQGHIQEANRLLGQNYLVDVNKIEITGNQIKAEVGETYKLLPPNGEYYLKIFSETNARIKGAVTSYIKDKHKYITLEIDSPLSQTFTDKDILKIIYCDNKF